MHLKDKVAIITGAGKGIGASIAKLLAEKRASIVIADINLSKAMAKAQDLNVKGYDVMAMYVDVTSEKSIEKMIRDTVERYSKIDILVNNAGIVDDKPIPDMILEDWEKVINTDLRGAHLCSKAVIKEMIKYRYGKIVNIASMAGQIGGLKVSPDYSAAKAGIIGLTKSYARFGAKYGINVNAVSPGFIKTDMTKGRDDPGSVPIGRLGTPEDVANAVYFLVSPLSTYITGATIDVNGGLLMR